MFETTQQQDASISDKEQTAHEGNTWTDHEQGGLATDDWDTFDDEAELGPDMMADPDDDFDYDDDDDDYDDVEDELDDDDDFEDDLD